MIEEFVLANGMMSVGGWETRLEEKKVVSCDASTEEKKSRAAKTTS